MSPEYSAASRESSITSSGTKESYRAGLDVDYHYEAGILTRSVRNRSGFDMFWQRIIKCCKYKTQLYKEGRMFSGQCT